MLRTSHWIGDAATELSDGIKGKVVAIGDDAYFRIRQIWNGAVDHQPALFAFCETVADVQNAVRIARARRIPLSVRGGGHDCAGRALRDGGLVIDLSGMRQVQVDAAARIATVAGGALAADVTAAATAHGLAAVTGNVGAVGVAGFLLGGGYGPLTPRFGLGADNLLGAEIVLADGRRVWADESHESDLFWGLRGGGGNFGVVSSMRLRLHPVSDVLAGFILFPWSEAQSILRGHADMMSSAPDELSVVACLFTGPDGNPSLFLGPVWTGGMKRGRELVAQMERLGTPSFTQVAQMSLADLLKLYDAHVVNGRHYAIQTRWLADLSPEVISAIVSAGGERTSPLSFVAIHYFHGAATRIAPGETAFPLRRNHFMLEIGAAWEPGPGDDGEAHRAWMLDLSRTIAPHALPGGYANLLAPDAHDQILDAYGANAPRLRSLKRKFDPENIFSSAIPLPP
jgi:FAD/FMN-containing dehydrogenase